MVFETELQGPELQRLVSGLRQWLQEAVPMWKAEPFVKQERNIYHHCVLNLRRFGVCVRKLLHFVAAGVRKITCCMSGNLGCLDAGNRSGNRSGNLVVNVEGRITCRYFPFLPWFPMRFTSSAPIFRANLYERHPALCSGCRYRANVHHYGYH